MPPSALRRLINRIIIVIIIIIILLLSSVCNIALRVHSLELWMCVDCSCVYSAAGHLPQKQHDYRRKYRTLASTYVTFGPDGNELLVNLGGEQIYLFDVNRQQPPQQFDVSIRQKIGPTVQSEFKGSLLAFCRS